MVLASKQQERLCKRLDALTDFGGAAKVAELAGVTVRVIQKAQSGGNVRVKTMESIVGALLTLEAERDAKVNQLNEALA